MKPINISLGWTICGSLFIVALLMAGCPQYRVFTEQKKGEAQLAHARASKEVQVAEAKAKMESAMYEAMADTTRAHGVARSNQIIGQSLNQNEAYLRWLWVNSLDKNPNVMYIATEAGLPITEAGRLGQIQSKKEEVNPTE